MSKIHPASVKHKTHWAVKSPSAMWMFVICDLNQMYKFEFTFTWHNAASGLHLQHLWISMGCTQINSHCTVFTIRVHRFRLINRARRMIARNSSSRVHGPNLTGRPEWRVTKPPETKPPSDFTITHINQTYALYVSWVPTLAYYDQLTRFTLAYV